MRTKRCNVSSLFRQKKLHITRFQVEFGNETREWPNKQESGHSKQPNGYIGKQRNLEKYKLKNN